MPNLRGVFVTGTDTGVGKTVVSAALMHRYRGEAPLRYWKPIQTGIEDGDDTSTIRWLGACAEEEIFDRGERLPLPLSPHLSARAAGRSIAVADLARLPSSQEGKHGWVVEGAGGILVPISDTAMMSDLMRQLGLSVIVAARSTLGTINHTLLTIEALRRRGIELAGAVLVGEPDPDNRAAIERFGSVAVLGEMPWFASLDPAALGAWARGCLDAAGLLRRFFRD
ncbi:MAG: dethiobiotin synthase [Acidobacteria bacterium]|nr:dethiobiotin synthase [Acidobacteriota bacterium]